MGKPLAHLPEEKKAKLLELAKRFNLDWPAAGIITGSEAKRAIADMDRRLERIKHGSGFEHPELVVNPDKPVSVVQKRKAPFKPGDQVEIKGNIRNKFTVHQVNDAGVGRTGFWAVLKYRGTELKYAKAVECADLMASSGFGFD